MEEWKVIPSYPGYEVSNIGNVRHAKSKRVRKQNKQKSRMNFYFKVTLSIKNIKKNVRVHRLVAEAFLPNFSSTTVVNHKNRNTFDNRVENLECVTQKENDSHWRTSATA